MTTPNKERNDPFYFFAKNLRRLRQMRSLIRKVRLDVFVILAVIFALVFLLGAHCILDQPRYPAGLDASLVPSRPVLVKIINSAGAFMKHCFGGFDPYPVNADAIELQAIRATGGLDDFGLSDYRDGLDAIVQALHQDAQLNFMGQIVMRSHLVRELQVRLTLQNYLNTHVGQLSLDLEKNPVERPVFIVGLPRTGTSLMHKMISAGSQTRWRTPVHWELLAPVPLPTLRSTASMQQSIDVSQFELEQLKKLAPGIERFHPMNSSAPEEDILIFAANMQSLAFATSAHVPSYMRYLNDANFSGTMRFHRKFLQYLQSSDKHAGRRWLLKAPQWCQVLGELLEMYPDAIVINMHRDPHAVLASISSLTTKLGGIVTDRLNTTGIGMAQQDYWERSMQSLLTWREQAGPEFNCRPMASHVHADDVPDQPEAAGRPCRIIDVAHDHICHATKAASVLRKIMTFLGVDGVSEAEIISMLEFKSNFGNKKWPKMHVNRSMFGYPQDGDFLATDSALMRYTHKYSPI